MKTKITATVSFPVDVLLEFALNPESKDIRFFPESIAPRTLFLNRKMLSLHGKTLEFTKDDCFYMNDGWSYPIEWLKDIEEKPIGITEEDLKAGAKVFLSNGQEGRLIEGGPTYKTTWGVGGFEGNFFALWNLGNDTFLLPKKEFIGWFNRGGCYLAK